MSFIFQDMEIIADTRLQRERPVNGFIRTAEASRNPRQLVWLTYWLDMRRFGFNAIQWRRSSMLLHLSTALMILPLSIGAAILFAVHPLTLMCSSYVAGRSGLISGMFQLWIAMLALNGSFLLAFLVAGVASLWVKEDSVMFFPMIGALWMAH